MTSFDGRQRAHVQTATNVETDMTCQAFAQWLTELKARSSKTLQEMLSEMSIIRDGITSSNMDLTDFKRHSTGISQQMQFQLTDLREKLTSAFGEITSLVTQKTTSDHEMMTDINTLQQNISSKTTELEVLKKSYTQAHSQLQSSLIQIQNHLTVTGSEVQASRTVCERVHADTTQRFGDIDDRLRALEDELSVGNAEHRNQMLQLQDEIMRIHESLGSVNSEFLDHKRAANSSHNKLQSQVWGIEEGRKRQQYSEPSGQIAQQTHPTTTPPQSSSSLQHAAHVETMTVLRPAGGSPHLQVAGQYRAGSLTMPQAAGSPSGHTMITPAMATRSSMMMPAVTAAYKTGPSMR